KDSCFSADCRSDRFAPQDSVIVEPEHGGSCLQEWVFAFLGFRNRPSAGVPYLRFSEPAVDELPERTRAVGPEDVACGSGYCSGAFGSQRAGSRCGTKRIRDEASKERGLDAVLERRRDGRIDGVPTTER